MCGVVCCAELDFCEFGGVDLAEQCLEALRLLNLAILWKELGTAGVDCGLVKLVLSWSRLNHHQSD